MTTKKAKTAQADNTDEVKPVEGDLMPSTSDAVSEERQSRLTDAQVNATLAMGRIDAILAMGKVSQALFLAAVQKFKDEKGYIHLAGQTCVRNGKEWKLNVWEGYCQYLGYSQSAMDEKLADLKKIGAAAYDRMEELGIPVKARRVLRNLGDDKLEEAVNKLEEDETTKEQAVDMVYQLGKLTAKHNKEKADLEAKLKTQQEDNAANERIISDKNQHIDKLQKQIVKRENATLDEQIKELYQELSLFEVEGISTLVKAEPIINDALATNDNGLRHEVTSALVNLRNRIDDLMLNVGLNYSDLMPFDDDEISEEDLQDAAQMQAASDTADLPED